MRPDSRARPTSCLAAGAGVKPRQGSLSLHPSPSQQCHFTPSLPQPWCVSVCTESFSPLDWLWVVFPPFPGLVSCWITGLNWFICPSAAHQCQQEGAGRGEGLGWMPSPAASASLGISPALSSHHTLRQKTEGHFSYSQDRCLDR